MRPDFCVKVDDYSALLSKAQAADDEYADAQQTAVKLDCANEELVDDGMRQAAKDSMFNKGQSNPTYLLTASDGHRYVVRKQPPGHLLAGAHNVGREYQVLDALKDTEVPVPRTLLFCDDPAVIGTVSAAFVAARLPACLAVNLLLACP